MRCMCMRKNNHMRCYVVHVKSVCFLYCFDLIFYAKNKNLAILKAKKYFFKTYGNIGNITFDAEHITEKEYFTRQEKEKQKVLYYADMIYGEFAEIYPHSTSSVDKMRKCLL